MNQRPADVLREIVESRGAAILDDPGRSAGLLRDLCGEHKLEISVLVAALEEGVAAELRQAPDATFATRRLARRLEEDRGVTAEAASWAVGAIAAALGLATAPASVGDQASTAAGAALSSATPQGEEAWSRRGVTGPTVACPKCGTANESARSECVICGTSLTGAVGAASAKPSSTDIVCAACGASVPPGQTRCPSCETLISDPAPLRRRNVVAFRAVAAAVAALLVAGGAYAVTRSDGDGDNKTVAFEKPEPAKKKATTTSSLTGLSGLGLPGQETTTTTGLVQSQAPAPGGGNGGSGGSLPKPGGTGTTSAPAQPAPPSGQPPSGQPPSGGAGTNTTQRIVTTTTQTTAKPAPVAKPDSYRWAPFATSDGSAWQQAILTVRDNDSDPSTYDYIFIDSEPTHGTVTYRASDGVYLYQPHHNGPFTDSFTYHLESRSRGIKSNVTTVSLTVDCNTNYVCFNG